MAVGVTEVDSEAEADLEIDGVKLGVGDGVPGIVGEGEGVIQE